MKDKIFTERMEIRLTKQHMKALKEIASVHKTTLSEAIRIVIMKEWLGQ